MKRLFFYLILLSTALVYGQKTESPYLEVVNNKSNIPLKSTKANVQIVGTIAHVQITQTFQNLGTTPIEANYVFPMSTQAAVHDMRMKIGSRTIKATIFEKQQANKIYQKAIKEGKRAAKLDQQRPNIFQMKVGNIVPKEEITVDIFYTEMLLPKDRDYQFVFPGVVGPRYTGESNSKEETFNTPYTKKGIASTFDYDLNVCINAGMMIQKVASETHELVVNYPNNKSAEIRISKNEENPANRDFIINYSLRGDKIQSGLLLYKGEKENFFSLMIQPPKKILKNEIPPREYIFIVDVSGSMNGYPLEVSKELMRNLLGNLRETDSFNIQLFASTSSIFKQKAVKATAKNIETGLQFLHSGSYYTGGGTQLIDALKTAYSLPKVHENTSKSMVVITDGYVNVEKDAFHLIENNLDKANVFTFGIGSSVNRYLIEGMAKIGKSESFIATNKNDAFRVAKRFKKYIASPLLTQIKLKTSGFDIYDVEPKTIPDVFAERPIVIYGKYKGEPKGKITIKGWQGNKKVVQKINVKTRVLSSDNKALKYLWARKRIERLNDYKKNFYDDVKQEVTQLGLAYNLATQYTSFVAVDSEIVNKNGSLKSVKQALPLPMNVNNSAVGASVEISGKSKVKKSFKILFSTNIKKQTKRAIQMWLKGTYSSVLKMYLQKHKNVKIHFDANGKIVKIEKEKNGAWLVDNNLSNILKKLPANIQLNKGIVVTLRS